MKRASRPAPADPARREVVIYARVSSKEQEKEGFSIPAQLKLLKEYAAANGFAVAQEYIDVETAKQTGRAAFGEMVAYLKAYPSVRVMLVEKTDRLYRNLKDWVTVDELNVEMHFPKEGVVLSRESRSSEKFMHGIKVLMAKNYIGNLSEEARKGMQEKAEQGIWPTKTPLGYRNITGPDGKKIITPDPALSPIVARLFECYARGDISLKEAARKAHAAGLTYPKSGARVPVSTVHTILRNRLYTGWFEWNGKLIQGKHEALVPVELWERVQGVLDGRFASKAKRGRHDFAFSGLIACHACGCAVVGEIKKQRYVYYHCTGYADKCQGNPASCRRKHVREEALEAQFTELLGRLRFDDEVLEWVRDALHANGATAEEIAILMTERVEINAMPSDALVAMIERKLAAYGLKKVIPDDKTLEEAYRAFHRSRGLRKAFAAVEKDYDAKAKDVVVPQGLQGSVRAILDQNRDLRWDDAVQIVLDKRGIKRVRADKRKARKKAGDFTGAGED